MKRTGLHGKKERTATRRILSNFQIGTVECIVNEALTNEKPKDIFGKIARVIGRRNKEKINWNEIVRQSSQRMDPIGRTSEVFTRHRRQSIRRFILEHEGHALLTLDPDILIEYNPKLRELRPAARIAYAKFKINLIKQQYDEDRLNKMVKGNNDDSTLTHVLVHQDGSQSIPTYPVNGQRKHYIQDTGQRRFSQGTTTSPADEERSKIKRSVSEGAVVYERFPKSVKDEAIDAKVELKEDRQDEEHIEPRIKYLSKIFEDLPVAEADGEREKRKPYSRTLSGGLQALSEAHAVKNLKETFEKSLQKNYTKEERKTSPTIAADELFQEDTEESTSSSEDIKETSDSDSTVSEKKSRKDEGISSPEVTNEEGVQSSGNEESFVEDTKESKAVEVKRKEDLSGGKGPSGLSSIKEMGESENGDKPEDAVEELHVATSSVLTHSEESKRLEREDKRKGRSKVSGEKVAGWL